MRENRYIKIKEILEAPSASSLSWPQAKTLFGKAAVNPLIQKSPAASYVNIFNSILGIVDPLLKINTILEKVKPIVNIGVQVVGAWANPALIPQLVQDGLGIIQKIAIKLAVQGVVTAKDYILNIEIDLGALGSDNLDKIKSKVDAVAGKLSKLAQNASLSFKNINTNIDLTKLNNDIKAFIESNKVNGSLAIDSSVSKEDALANLKTECDKIGTFIDDNINYMFAKMDDAIEDSKNVMTNEIMTAMEKEDIDVTDIEAEFAGDTKTLGIIQEIKNGFLQALKNIIVENYKALLTDYLAKSSSDVEALVLKLKEDINTDITNKKYLCMKKMLADLEGVTDLNDIKNIMKSHLSGFASDYSSEDMVRKLLNGLLKGFEQYKKDRNDGSDDANKRNRELNDIALEVFDGFSDALKIRMLLDISKIKVDPISLENDQIITDNYSSFIDDTCQNTIDFINALVSFDVNDIKANTDSFVDGYSLSSYFNDIYSDGEKTVCYKFSSVRGALEEEAEKVFIFLKKNYRILFSAVIPVEVTDEDEKVMVMEYVDKMIFEIVQGWYYTSVDVLIKNTVPCRECISCSTLKVKILAQIRNNCYLLKKFVKETIYSAISSVSYDGTLAQNKATAIGTITNDLKDLMTEKQSYYYRYNEIYKKYCFDEEKKLIAVLLEMLSK